MAGRWLKRKGAKNPFRYRADGAVEIKLTRGKVAIVDAGDLETMGCQRWYVVAPFSPRSYARTRIASSGKTRQKVISLAHFLLKAPKGLIVIYMNSQGLDCRRCNLRLGNRTNACQKARKRPKTSSRFKGVSWRQHQGKWVSYITADGRRKHLGCFAGERDAGAAYDEAALKHFGPFARLNFPQEAV